MSYYMTGDGEIHYVPDEEAEEFLHRNKGARRVLSGNPPETGNLTPPPETKVERRGITPQVVKTWMPVREGNTALPGAYGDRTSFKEAVSQYMRKQLERETASRKDGNRGQNAAPGFVKQEGDGRKDLYSVPGPLAKGRPFEETVEELMQKRLETESARPENRIHSDFVAYKAAREWIDRVNADPDMPQEEKERYNEWFRESYRPTDFPVDGVRLPPALQRAFERDLKPGLRPVPLSPMGPAVYLPGHTPEQERWMADFYLNSVYGRKLKAEYDVYGKALEEQIEVLGKEVDRMDEERRRLVGPYENFPPAIHTEAEWKKHFEKKSEVMRLADEKYPLSEIETARSQLEKLKRMKAASYDRSKNGWLQFSGELLRELPGSLLNTATLSIPELVENINLAKVLKDPDKKLARRSYDLLNEYASLQEGSLAQDIARGIADGLPYLVQTPFVGGATAGTSKAVAKTLSKVLPAKIFGGVAAQKGIESASEIATGLAANAMMPATWADAYRRQAGDPGSDLPDNYRQSAKASAIDYLGNKLGGGKKGKVKKANDMGPSFVEKVVKDYAGGYVTDMGHVFFGDGQVEWPDLADPHRQLAAFGQVAVMSSPGEIKRQCANLVKYMDKKKLQGLQKVYNQSDRNLTAAFGDDAPGIRDRLKGAVDAAGEKSLSMDQLLSGVVDPDGMTSSQAGAVAAYTGALLAGAGVWQGRNEYLAGEYRKIDGLVGENLNPAMDALVTARITGYGEPLQVVSGRIVAGADGGIDPGKSDRSVVVVDSDGKRRPVAIGEVLSVDENIPKADAIAYYQQEAASGFDSRLEKESAPAHKVGDIVTAGPQGDGTPFTGTITAINEDGRYTVAAPDGSESVLEPARVQDTSHLYGLREGSVVTYTDPAGKVLQGVAADVDRLQRQGAIVVDGQAVPADRVLTVEPQDGGNGSQDAKPENRGDRRQESGFAVTNPLPTDEDGKTAFHKLPAEETVAILKEQLGGDALNYVVSALEGIEKEIGMRKNRVLKNEGILQLIKAGDENIRQQKELEREQAYWSGVKYRLDPRASLPPLPGR